MKKNYRDEQKQNPNKSNHSQNEGKRTNQGIKGVDGCLETKSSIIGEMLNSEFNSVFESDALDSLPDSKRRAERTLELN